MIPYVSVPPLDLGFFELHPFGILVAIGIAIGWSLALRRARWLGLGEMDSFVVWILVGGFLGAHWLDSVFYHPDELLARPWSILELWVGLSSFGGFVGAAVGAFSWKYLLLHKRSLWGTRWRVWSPKMRARPVSLLPYADVILAVFPVAWIFGRAGCAVVHDHPGAHTAASSWLGVGYGPGPVDDFGLFQLRHGIEARYDLGLLEMFFAMGLALAFALTWRFASSRGWYVAASCLVYAPVRFALDFLRSSDPKQGGDLRYAGFTPAQWACTFLFAFGAWLAIQVANAEVTDARFARDA